MVAFLLMSLALVTALALPAAAPCPVPFERQSASGTVPLAGVAKNAYPSMAKLPLEAAVKIAQKRCAGKLHSALLENENGFLVYSIEIETDGGLHETLVDAGNGSILSDSSAPHGTLRSPSSSR